jgi:hypothetical protein
MARESSRTQVRGLEEREERISTETMGDGMETHAPLDRRCR